jgi:hypothetical protein
MSKPNIITIDLDKWTTQTKAALELGVRENTYIQRIKRQRDKGETADLLIIPELNITLVKKP